MSSLPNRQGTSLTARHTLQAVHTQDPPPLPFNPTSEGFPRAFGTRYLPFLQEEHPQLQPASQDTPRPHDPLPPSTPPPATCSANTAAAGPAPHICCGAAGNAWGSSKKKKKKGEIKKHQALNHTNHQLIWAKAAPSMQPGSTSPWTSPPCRHYCDRTATGLAFWPRLSQVHCQEPLRCLGREEEGSDPPRQDNRGVFAKKVVGSLPQFQPGSESPPAHHYAHLLHPYLILLLQLAL